MLHGRVPELAAGHDPVDTQLVVLPSGPAQHPGCWVLSAGFCSDPWTRRTVKCYLISQVEVIDPEAWQRYRELAAPAIARFGGTYLVRGARPEVVEGDDWAPPHADSQQIIVAEFPTSEAIHDWYNSPEYAEAYAYRQPAVRRRLLFVDGVDDSVA